MPLQKNPGSWGTESCLEFENPIQNTEETWILVKVTCSVTELDYVKVFGREPSTGFGKRGNAAVGLLSGSGESWALLSARLSGLISTTDIPESTVQPQCCAQAGAWRNRLPISEQLSGWLDKKGKCSAAMAGVLQEPLLVRVTDYCCASLTKLVSEISTLRKSSDLLSHIAEKNLVTE